MTAIFNTIDEVVSQQEQHLSAIHNALGAISAANELLVTTSPVVHKSLHSALTNPLELAQDMKAIYGLDADTELVNILSTKLAADLNKAAKEEEVSE